MINTTNVLLFKDNIYRLCGNKPHPSCVDSELNRLKSSHSISTQQVNRLLPDILYIHLFLLILYIHLLNEIIYDLIINKFYSSQVLKILKILTRIYI